MTRTGYAIMAARYEQLGIHPLLPLERVWAGTGSAARPGTARGHGGFHHPAQGYRHIQMDAAVTVFGDLTGRDPASPQAAALDLVRSYAHDCLHYGTFRRYRLSDRGEIARVQYGINLGRFARTVTLRYRALLSELDASPADAHSQVVAAMISGHLAPLQAWLDARHGPGSFARMFRAPSSGAEPERVR
jgi:hypothetical protein